MSKRRSIDVNSIVSEMSAVAAFARSNPIGVDDVSGEAGSGALLSALVATPRPESARESRTIAGGKYKVAVGWDAEPVIEGQRSAATISILRADTRPTQPVQGAEETLRVRLGQEAETREFPLRRIVGQEGHYAAHFVPTRAGSYTFTFVGTIEGNPVEEMFDSAGGQFGSVQPSVETQFPVCLNRPTRAEPALQEVQSSPQRARLLAAAGLSIGLLGMLGGILTWRTRPAGRSRSDAAIGALTSPERRQEPVRPRTTEADAREYFGQEFGPALQEQIAAAIQPVVAEFRHETVRAVREQTEQAIQPFGWRPN